MPSVVPLRPNDDLSTKEGRRAFARRILAGIGDPAEVDTDEVDPVENDRAVASLGEEIEGQASPLTELPEWDTLDEGEKQEAAYYYSSHPDDGVASKHFVESAIQYFNDHLR